MVAHWSSYEFNPQLFEKIVDLFRSFQPVPRPCRTQSAHANPHSPQARRQRPPRRSNRRPDTREAPCNAARQVRAAPPLLYPPARAEPLPRRTCPEQSAARGAKATPRDLRSPPPCSAPAPARPGSAQPPCASSSIHTAGSGGSVAASTFFIRSRCPDPAPAGTLAPVRKDPDIPPPARVPVRVCPHGAAR